MKKLTICLSILALVFSCAAVAGAESFTLSAAQIKAVMADYDAPLSDATYFWGLWSVRTMPIVNGGYTITETSTNQTGWGSLGPYYLSWPSPYDSSKYAYFFDYHGAEVLGNSPNPLYMIMDQPASNFTSYFDNIVTAVDDSSTFTVNFTLDAGASWNGWFQFVVDGSRYLADANPAPWETNFFGGLSGDFSDGNDVSTNGGDLICNMNAGYHVPLPSAVWLMGPGLVGLEFYRRRKMLF
jgi:hypothetical protein